MPTLRPHPAFCLSATLAAWAFASPVLAQSLQGITLQDIRLMPVSTPLPANRAAASPGDPQFIYQDGILTLSGPRPGQVLWQNPLGEQPQAFLLVTDTGSETLEDAAGRQVYRGRFDTPGLTLTVGADGRAVLTDFTGKRLWSGPVQTNGTFQGVAPPSGGSGASAPGGLPGTAVTDNDDLGGFVYRATVAGTATFRDTGGHVFWSGPAPTRKGVRIVMPDGSRNEANVVHEALYPPNKTLRVTFAVQHDTVTMTDEQGRLIGTRPAPALRTTIQDAANPAAPLPFANQCAPQPPDIQFFAPGTVEAVYHDPGGVTIRTERVTVSPMQLVPHTDDSEQISTQEIKRFVLSQGKFVLYADEHWERF